MAARLNHFLHPDRVSHPCKGKRAYTGSSDLDAAVAKQAAENALVNFDCLNLFDDVLVRFPGDDARLQNHATARAAHLDHQIAQVCGHGQDEQQERPRKKIERHADGPLQHGQRAKHIVEEDPGELDPVKAKKTLNLFALAQALFDIRHHPPAREQKQSG